MPVACLLFDHRRGNGFGIESLKPSQIFRFGNLVESDPILFPKFLLELGLPSKAIQNVVGGNPVLFLFIRWARETESVTSLGRSGIRTHCSPHVSSGPIANLRMRVPMDADLRTASISSLTHVAKIWRGRFR